MHKTAFENSISKDKSILLVLYEQGEQNMELQALIRDFCGRVVYDINELPAAEQGAKIYYCGNCELLDSLQQPVYAIKDFCNNYENRQLPLLELGELPMLVHGVGVYFKKLFGTADYFNRIKAEHQFQELKESNKESFAFRKGIYLSEIVKTEDEQAQEQLHFHLLRCSSNLSGPTDNFRSADHEIINRLNEEARFVFEKSSKLNHVLVQIYENKGKTKEQDKEIKSKIKAHSDKTKDMPKDGIMAFCSFYDPSGFEQLKASDADNFDFCYKQISGLTKLHFKLKNSVKDDTLVKEFTVILYPNSAFFIPLSTNRLYTHEIRPSMLNVERIPTRMGYVARCSNQEAVYTQGRTYLKEDGKLLPLEHITPEMMADLRNSYYEENTSDHAVEYGKIHFSMNAGDYERPLY